MSSTRCTCVRQNATGAILFNDPACRAAHPHPQYPCSTPGCPGDARYAPPGRGHNEICWAAFLDMVRRYV